MEEYVENYQTAVDTQSGQSWQKLQQNLEKSFSSLNEMSIASDKSNAERIIKNTQEAQKWEANKQADYLAQTTDNGNDKVLGKVKDPDFTTMLNGVALKNAEYGSQLKQHKILTEDQQKIYANTTLFPTKTKSLIEGITNIGITRNEMGAKAGAAGGFSAYNKGGKFDAWTTASEPKPGEEVQVKFEKTDDDYSSVKAVIYRNNQKVKFGDKDLELTLDEIQKWSNPEAAGEDGAIPIVDAPSYVDATKTGAIDTISNTPIFISKATLKTGQPSTMVGTVDPLYLDKKNKQKSPVNKEDGTYTFSYKLNAKGLSAIEASAKAQVGEMDLSKKISWMVDNLGYKKDDYPIEKLKDPNTIADMDAKIMANIISKLNIPYPEMDETGSGVVIHKDKELENSNKETKAQKTKRIKDGVLAMALERGWNGANIIKETNKALAAAGLL